MATKNKAQIGMDDRIISNSELLALLEERESLREAARAFRNKDKDAKDAVMKLDEPMPYRIGRFIISETKREGRHIDFEVSPSSSVKITTADE